MEIGGNVFAFTAGVPRGNGGRFQGRLQRPVGVFAVRKTRHRHDYAYFIEFAWARYGRPDDLTKATHIANRLQYFNKVDRRIHESNKIRIVCQTEVTSCYLSLEACFYSYTPIALNYYKSVAALIKTTRRFLKLNCVYIIIYVRKSYYSLGYI